MNHENPITSRQYCTESQVLGPRDYISVGNELSGGSCTRETPNEAVYLVVACPRVSDTTSQLDSTHIAPPLPVIIQ